MCTIKHTVSILECRTISQNMISKTLARMDGSKSSLKTYHYTSFSDFGLTIRNKLKMSNHYSLDYAPKFRALICEEQPHRKRPL
jgi:hypothetical protein